MTVANNPTRHALYLDGTVKEGDLLASADFLEQAARSVAFAAGMRILKLEVHDIDEDLSKLDSEVFEDEGGKSLHALLSTSHLSIHGWPKRSVFMFDLVSCRRFNQATVEAYVLDKFKVETIVHRDTTDAVWPSSRVLPVRRLDPIKCGSESRSSHHSSR